MANIISPPVATGKINLSVALNDKFPKDLAHKPNKYAVDIRIPLDTKDPKELEFISSLLKLEQEILKDEPLRSGYSIVIDPRRPDFKEMYTGSSLSLSDYTIKCKLVARAEKPKAKAYELIKIADRQARLITTDQGLDVFVEGCNVIAVFVLSKTIYMKKAGVSAYLKGIQFHSAGDPFLPEQVSFSAIDVGTAPPEGDDLVLAFS